VVAARPPPGPAGLQQRQHPETNWAGHVTGFAYAEWLPGQTASDQWISGFGGASFILKQTWIYLKNPSCFFMYRLLVYNVCAFGRPNHHDGSRKRCLKSLLEE
jgi:hypothetical protein